jgi:transposase-like protein
VAVSFKGVHFPKEVILMGIRWYLAYPLSTRHVEELMEERGVKVDHSTINRWVIKYSLQLEDEFHRRKRPVWVSWRMDETYINVKGEWVYLYRAVDKFGKTIDFLLTKQRDKKAARRFLNKAIGRHGVPEKSPSMAATPMPRPSRATMPITAPQLKSARSNISIISWSRITEQ